MASRGLWMAAACVCLLSTDSTTVEEDPKGAAFMSFFRKLGGQAPAIELVLFPSGAGRGVRAARPMKKGDVVASIPMSMVIHGAMAVQDPELRRDLEGQRELESGQRTAAGGALAIWLCYQRAQGARSMAYSYINLLPGVETMSDPLRFIDDPAAAGALQSSPLAEHLRKRNENLTEELQHFKQYAKSDWAKSLTFDEYRWAATNVARRSYMIRHDSGSGWRDVPCLPPLADLFNTGANDEINADCATNAKSTAFVCYATEDVAAGEQMLVPYAAGAQVGDRGKLSAELPLSELLRDYGFTMPAQSSWASPESARLSLPPLPSAACDGRCRSFEAQWDLTMSQLQPLAGGQLIQAEGDGIWNVVIPSTERIHRRTKDVPPGLRWVYAYALLAALANTSSDVGVTEATQQRLQLFVAQGLLDELLRGEPATACATAATLLRSIHAARILEYGSSLEADNEELAAMTNGSEGQRTGSEPRESLMDTVEAGEEGSREQGAGAGWIFRWFSTVGTQKPDSHEVQTSAMPTGVRSYLIDALRVRIAEKVTLEWLEYCARDFDRHAQEFVSNQPLPRGDGKKRRKVRKRPVPGDL